MSESNYIVDKKDRVNMKILDLKYYGVVRFKENYLLRFPNRSEIQAINYAERKVRELIKKERDKLKEFEEYMNNDNLKIVSADTFDLS